MELCGAEKGARRANMRSLPLMLLLSSTLPEVRIPASTPFEQAAESNGEEGARKVRGMLAIQRPARATGQQGTAAKAADQIYFVLRRIASYARRWNSACGQQKRRADHHCHQVAQAADPCFGVDAIDGAAAHVIAQAEKNRFVRDDSQP